MIPAVTITPSLQATVANLGQFSPEFDLDSDEYHDALQAIADHHALSDLKKPENFKFLLALLLSIESQSSFERDSTKCDIFYALLKKIPEQKITTIFLPHFLLLVEELKTARSKADAEKIELILSFLTVRMRLLPALKVLLNVLFEKYTDFLPSLNHAKAISIEALNEVLLTLAQHMISMTGGLIVLKTLLLKQSKTQREVHAVQSLLQISPLLGRQNALLGLEVSLNFLIRFPLNSTDPTIKRLGSIANKNFSTLFDYAVHFTSTTELKTMLNDFLTMISSSKTKQRLQNLLYKAFTTLRASPSISNIPISDEPISQSIAEMSLTANNTSAKKARTTTTLPKEPHWETYYNQLLQITTLEDYNNSAEKLIKLLPDIMPSNVKLILNGLLNNLMDNINDSLLKDDGSENEFEPENNPTPGKASAIAEVLMTIATAAHFADNLTEAEKIQFLRDINYVFTQTPEIDAKSHILNILVLHELPNNMRELWLPLLDKIEGLQCNLFESIDPNAQADDLKETLSLINIIFSKITRNETALFWCNLQKMILTAYEKQKTRPDLVEPILTILTENFVDMIPEMIIRSDSEKQMNYVMSILRPMLHFVATFPHQSTNLKLAISFAIENIAFTAHPKTEAELTMNLAQLESFNPNFQRFNVNTPAPSIIVTLPRHGDNRSRMFAPAAPVRLPLINRDGATIVDLPKAFGSRNC